MTRLYAMLAALVVASPWTFLAPDSASAQSSAAQILERARGQAREIEELRKILLGPDQNMRLATFDAMVKSGNDAMIAIAYETGLASADSIMRAMAFKAMIMSMSKLYLTLAPDPGAPKAIQEASVQYLAKNGNELIVPLEKWDTEAATFAGRGWRGQVSGAEFVFDRNAGDTSARMALADDNAISGIVRMHSGKTQFLATSKLR